MKLGVFNPLFDGMGLEEMLDHVRALGLEAVELRSGPNSVSEIRAGHYPAQEQFDPAVLLSDETELRALREAFKQRGIAISALSCHGNPVHPDKEIARIFHRSFTDSVLAAEKLQVPIVVVFSGCPGGSPRDETPNWITYTWPPEYDEALKYQWESVLIPYWREAAAFAKQHHVRIAVEPHPGFNVYNTASLLKLREAVGETIGANFDPSHFFWQGIDVPHVIAGELRGAIYHFHAKDTFINTHALAANGVLDVFHTQNLRERPFYFRTVGYGQGEQIWREIISALRLAGYDYVISIEHEDPLASRDEGLGKAVDLFTRIVFREETGARWWER